MTSAKSDQIVTQLHSALETGRLPAHHQALGVQVLDHLSQAVSVVVLGRAGSGKSSLINMLMGGEVLAPPASVEMCDVVYGDRAKLTLGWSDGTTRAFWGTAVDASEAEGAIWAKYELPLQTLRSQRYCEIAQPNEPTRQRDLLETALAKGQVFVWCSELFDRAEQKIWTALPETVKDHSFLALTKADRQIMKGDLSERIAELEAVAADEFLGLHPVATLHGLKARCAENFQADLWEASGGRDLSEAVQAQVQKGRSADLDQAAMLLAQVPDRDVAPTQADTLGRGRNDTEAPCDQQMVLLDELQTHLQTAAQEMLADLDAGKVPDADVVVSRCTSALNGLTEMLSDAAATEGGVFEGLMDDAQDGGETLTLLQVEQNAKAAEDAVVVLLQLKKEIGARAPA
ncbi:hypothetical protein J7413_11745 [Shimia sp. R10_1]|uniref:GTPase domain-containing protein n=1 Tax=Shimia sp. R10_1 TaxID=2821095 RepID=UPI001ADAAAB7|nr:GTPase domain-containing protein [Shimia sp. R10_1]MBO9474213.1 hypothetical protein [Shimia sp. R10_1]